MLQSTFFFIGKPLSKALKKVTQAGKSRLVRNFLTGKSLISFNGCFSDFIARK